MLKSHTGINEEDKRSPGSNRSSSPQHLIKRRAVVNPIKEQFQKFHQLFQTKVEQMIEVIKQRDSYKKLYLILFELNQEMLQTEDNLQFIQFLIFSGDLLDTLGDDNKAFYFFNQARKICDWVHRYCYLKPQLYRKLGDICLK